MNTPNIGVDVDDYRLETKDAFRKASEHGFRVVEFATVGGDLEPSNLSRSGRRHLLRHVAGLGLGMASLTADIPGLRLTDPRTVCERVERTCRIIDLARDLKVPVVTASAGALTHPESGDPSPLAMDALKRIGECADARGVIYALRPGHDAGDRIVRVQGELRCPSIQICLDPAAMVMAGADPLSVFERLPEQIALLHARDGTAGRAELPGHETRLGEGEVDLVGVLALLSAVDYTGPYIIRRIDSQTPLADLRDARAELTRLLGPG